MVDAIVATIDEMAALLAGEPLAAKEAARRLGAGFEDPGHGLPLRVASKDERLISLQVASRTDSSDVAHVEAVFREGARPIVRELAAAFGEYMEPPRVHADSPHRIVFRHARTGAAAHITLIATLSAWNGDPGECPIESVTLRRDALD